MRLLPNTPCAELLPVQIGPSRQYKYLGSHTPTSYLVHNTVFNYQPDVRKRKFSSGTGIYLTTAVTVLTFNYCLHVTKSPLTPAPFQLNPSKQSEDNK